jgi:RNA polymerase sigma factor (sigma-70 family)
VWDMLDNGVRDLVQRAQADDAQAWRQLHDLMSASLLGEAQRLFGRAWPTASWHDLVQVTWQRAYQGFDSFRGGPDDEQTGAMLRAWLRRIMRNVHANMLREANASPRQPPTAVVSLALGQASGSVNVMEPPAADPSPSHAARAEERTARIAEALAQLTDPLDKRVVELVFFESRNLRQTGADLGLTYDQVRYRLDKVLVRLGEYLKEPL